MNTVCILGVEAPARQGARSAHTGWMQATSNAARRDASAFRMCTLFMDESFVDIGSRPRSACFAALAMTI